MSNGENFLDYRKQSRFEICERNYDSPADTTHCFAYYCDEWVRSCSGRLKESTRSCYETILTRHIKPKLGCNTLPDISTKRIETFSDELIAQGLSPKTVRDILALLHSILKFTEIQYPNLISTTEIIYPRSSRKEARVLTRLEQKRLVAYLMDNMDSCKLGVFLAISTGMRIGELCALRWENISLDDETIRITAALQRIKSQCEDGRRTKIIIDTPKSSTSVRTIPLTDTSVKLCKIMDPQKPSAFLLTGNESYMEPRTLQYRLGKYTEECGLRDVHFHTLRHTFATRCVEAGFEMKSLSEILGHANTTFTLNRYVHSSIELKRYNMRKLEAFEL